MRSPWFGLLTRKVHAPLLALLMLVSLSVGSCRTREYNSGKSSFGSKKPEEAGWKGQPSVSLGACYGEAVTGGKPLLLFVRNFDGNHSSIVRLEVVGGTLATVTDAAPLEMLTLSGAGLSVAVPGFGGKGGGSYRYASEYLGTDRLGDGTAQRHLDSHLAWYEKNPSEKIGDVYEKRAQQVETLRVAHGEQLAQKATLGSILSVLGKLSEAAEFDISADYMPNPRRVGSGGDGDLTVRWMVKGVGSSFEAKLRCETALSKESGALDAPSGPLLALVDVIRNRKSAVR